MKHLFKQNSNSVYLVPFQMWNRSTKMQINASLEANSPRKACSSTQTFKQMLIKSMFCSYADMKSVDKNEDDASSRRKHHTSYGIILFCFSFFNLL